VRLLAGTSGFAFKEWKGSFYPDDLPADGMLGFYAERFPTVEINNTFYRLPKEHVLRDWAAQVPETFTFAIKASQRITHFARLKPAAKDPLDFLLRNTEVMGGRLGAILFQLPPNLEKDVDRLRAFLDLLPGDRRFSIEFRHSSWFDEDVVSELRSRDVALCISEQDDFITPPVPTASWGYLRLHRFDYNPATLADWGKRVHDFGWSDAYVYFKHDEATGETGPMSGPSAVDAFYRFSANAIRPVPHVPIGTA
jgi:uncharacterized protein YecE (DUF72 family)